MITILTLLIGALIGMLFTRMIDTGRIIGNLKVCVDDPVEGPYMFLEFEKHPQEMAKHHFVILRVKITPADPRK